MNNNTAQTNSATTALTGVVPVTYVQLLYDYLTLQNIDAVALLGELPKTEKGIGRFPVLQWQAYLDKASSKLNDSLLGLHLGETITPKHLGVLGYVLLACGTLGAALLRLQQYHQLIYDVNPMQVHTSGKQLILQWGQEMGRPGALVDETAIAALVQFCRDITGQANYAPVSVAFVNPAPADIQTYEKWFGCPVLFEQSETHVAVDIDVLQTPLRSADAGLIEILERQANELLNDLETDDNAQVSQTVRSLIMQKLREAEPTADGVAAEFNITGRTLHRKLAVENTSFRQLLQQTRHELAKEYLSDQRLQISEIAQLLGYSEQSALNRAFKQWQGETPKQYRNKSISR